MKLNRAKTAAKTAKFQATMARKRVMKNQPEEPLLGTDSIALDAIPDRAPRKATKVRSFQPTRQAAIELLRIALKLLEQA